MSKLIIVIIHKYGFSLFPLFPLFPRFPRFPLNSSVSRQSFLVPFDNKSCEGLGFRVKTVSHQNLKKPIGKTTDISQLFMKLMV